MQKSTNEKSTDIHKCTNSCCFDLKLTCYWKISTLFEFLYMQKKIQMYLWIKTKITIHPFTHHSIHSLWCSLLVDLTYDKCTFRHSASAHAQWWVRSRWFYSGTSSSWWWSPPRAHWTPPWCHSGTSLGRPGGRNHWRRYNSAPGAGSSPHRYYLICEWL